MSRCRGASRLTRGILLLVLSGVLVATATLAGNVDSGDSSTGRVDLPRAPRRHGTYRNLDPEFRAASNWTRLRVYLLGLASLVRQPPFKALSLAKPDIRRLWQNHHDPTVTWIGHSTLLVQFDGVNFLTDPVWNDRVGPFSGRFGVRRFTPPGLAFEQLPPIDLVLISHDHYDHLDEPTVRRLQRTFHPHFVVPLGIGGWLEERDITNVTELDWGDSVSFRGLQIVCTPAQHGSGRTLFDSGKRLWSSWAVIGSRRFYFGGDSGYAEHYRMIGRLLGPFDLAALPIGSYTPRFLTRPIHLSPEDALEAYEDLRATRLIPIHWGTFELAQEPYDEPPQRLLDAARRLRIDPDRILIPKPGEVLDW